MHTITLDALAALPRWVGWRNELREGDDEPTKVPYQPGTLFKAKADNPASWRTRREAEAWARQHVNGQGGGIGLELGDLGNGYSLAGVDFDKCRAEDGTIAPWAREVIQHLNTYAETSPSGTGVKAFLAYRTADLPALRETMGLTPEQWGRQWKRGSGKHPPAIEVYLGRRYFATTRERLPNSPDELRVVPLETLLWIIREAGPNFAGKSDKRQSAKAGQDSSRSATAFRMGAKLRREGKTYEEMVAALRADAATADWAREKGAANSGREFRRIWDKAGEAADPTLTEDGIALAFAAEFQDDLRFDHHSGHWHQWDGVRWRKEETRLAFDWARTTCRTLAQSVKADGKLAAILGRASTAGAVERFAQADRAVAVTSEIWDRDPFLLGTPGGTVDLRTGGLNPAKQSDLITKICAVIPAETPDCPLWLKFLEEVTRGDREMVRFIRQWLGYTLTGDTREHALLFVFGPGGNGKSVLLNTVSGILGDYCRVAAMETFTASNSDRHPTDLAMLQGARMVCASETEEGRAWAESRIKQLTGGDRIAARFMRQDFFEFQPQFKLTIIGNNKPVLRNVDEAARRRINMLPFVHKPPVPDKALEQKLRAEWPAILRWMIEGCMIWQKTGLAPPQAVIDATNKYLESEDAIASWIADRCECKASYQDTSAKLFASWKSWAEQTYGRNRGKPKAVQRKASRPRHGAKTDRPYKGPRLRRNPRHRSETSTASRLSG